MLLQEMYCQEITWQCSSSTQYFYQVIVMYHGQTNSNWNSLTRVIHKVHTIALQNQNQCTNAHSSSFCTLQGLYTPVQSPSVVRKIKRWLLMNLHKHIRFTEVICSLNFEAPLLAVVSLSPYHVLASRSGKLLKEPTLQYKQWCHVTSANQNNIFIDCNNYFFLKKLGATFGWMTLFPCMLKDLQDKVTRRRYSCPRVSDSFTDRPGHCGRGATASL